MTIPADTLSLRHPWVGIAANPSSGTGKGRRRVLRLIDSLARHDLQARVAWTPAERAELVAQATPENACRALVAAGGDGTVAALINEQPRVPITVLPVGTENLFARHFRIRPRPDLVARTVACARPAPLDLGQIGGRRFALMAGIGFDAEVVTQHHLHRIRHSGSPRPTSRAAYVLPTLRAAWSYRFPPITVHLDDPGHEETLVGTSVFLFNLPRYALGLPFAPAASGSDGLLDLLVFQKPGSFQALKYLWLVFRQIHLDSPGITHRRVRRARISSLTSVPLQLDGDPAGELLQEAAQPACVEVLPSAITVLAPE